MRKGKMWSKAAFMYCTKKVWKRRLSLGELSLIYMGGLGLASRVTLNPRPKWPRPHDCGGDLEKEIRVAGNSCDTKAGCTRLCVNSINVATVHLYPEFRNYPE